MTTSALTTSSVVPARNRASGSVGRSGLGPLLVLVGGVGLAVYAAMLQHEVELRNRRTEVRQMLEPIVGGLSRELFSAFHLMEGIAGVVRVEGGMDDAKFRALAATLLERNNLIRNVALAPDNIVRLVYPLEGNEAVVGLNYASHLEQWPGVRRAMEERRLIVAGPVKLVQGGRAVIGRRPIFVPGRAGEAGQDRYWGVVSTVIELDRLLERAPLAEAERSLDLALRGQDGQGVVGLPFYGPGRVFAGNPVLLEVPLPTGSWQLAGLPRGGWPPLRLWRSPTFWGGALLALLLSGLVEHTRRSAAAARQNETLFRMLAEEALDGVYLIQDGRFVYVNPAMAAILGRSRQDLLGLPAVLELVAPEDRERVAENLRRRLSGENIAESQEFKIFRPDGQRRLLETLGCVTNFQGRLAVLGTARDITERREAERRLDRLNRTLAVMSDINQLIMREREPRAILAGACRVATEIGGFRLAWVGMVVATPDTLDVIAHSRAAPDTLAILETMCREPGAGCAFTARALAEGQPVVCNDVANAPESAPWRTLALERGYRAMISLPLRVGERTAGVFNLYAGEAGFFDAEELKLLSELAQDLGFALEYCEREQQRREAENALRTSRELFRELAETIEEVFWMREVSGNRILYISPAYERIWGRSVQDLYANPDRWLEAVHPEDREQVRAAVARRQTSGEYDVEYRIVRLDGQVRWIRDRAYPVRTPTGEIIRLVGVARDITEPRYLAEQLRQVQKMEAVGLLAGGVAHDFNNILAVVQLQAELTAAVPGLSDKVREGLAQIRAAAERAAQLTRRLLLFSRREVMQPRVLNLNDVITALVRMLRRVIGENIELQLSLASQSLPVRADPGMLDQVLLNLALNARDAMPNGGHLLVETGELTVDSASVRQHPDRHPGQYVWVRVSDTGTGISPQVLPHIFEPFFTTKETGKGTGLGLAIVYGIVQQHRGWIEVRSKVGQGTTFEIYLPAHSEVAAAQPVAPPSALSALHGTETILLVEDESSVRELTRTLLEQAGYRVLTAANGESALAQWLHHREAVALLLSDLVMPGGWTGRELARRFRTDKPDLRVVYMSGYSADVAGTELTPSRDEVFLPKPFNSETLLRTVRQCLDA